MLDSLWSRMLVALGTRVPPAALDSWLRPCRLTAVEGDHIKITAPNPYTRDWLHQHDARKQIVVSSDAAPKEIPDLEERLRSRFEWGLIADIQPPDFETRVAILKKKAEIERVLLPDDVAYLIASRIKANIREIEGSLTRMIAYCSLSGREMSIELAQDVLADLWGEEERIITIEHIQRKAAEFFGIKLSDMRAKNRTKSVAFPRQVAMYLSRQLTHASLSDIGRSFGGKDHTTVLHAVTKLQSMIQEDTKLKQTIDTLTQGITL